MNQEWPGLKASPFKIKIIGVQLVIFTVLSLILFLSPAFTFGRLKSGVSKKTAPDKILEDRSEPTLQTKAGNYEIKTEIVVRARIGSGPEDLGVIMPEEANPEGPMSFIVGSAGEIYVLDQTNARIQVFKNGKYLKTIKIPDEVFSDLVLLPGGRIALLDSLVKEAVFIIDKTGNLVETISLRQKEIPVPESIIGLYFCGEGDWAGLWAQADNSSLRLAEADGKPAAQLEKLPGLLNFKGKNLLKLELEDKKQAIVLRSDETFKNWSQFKVHFELPLGQVFGFWEDLQGRLFLAVNLFNEKNEVNQTIVLNSQGNELARLEMFVLAHPAEIYFPVRVTPEGEIYQLMIEKEVVIRKYSLF
ncbi:MAG: hypothetical protein ACUVR0_10275 [Candidatus Aminicenantales bacterium]